jgi:plastocyanin domain-containing protein
MKKTTGLLYLFLFLAAPVTTFAANGSSSLQTPKNVTTVYTNAKDISPNTFTVESGQKVRLEINPTDSGSGCMSAIMIPGLWDKPEPLVKGKKIVMEFTPKHPGAYKITCAMGVQRGVINVR